MQVVIEHTPGEENWLADQLSRRHAYGETVQALDSNKEVKFRLHDILGPVWEG